MVDLWPQNHQKLKIKMPNRSRPPSLIEKTLEISHHPIDGGVTTTDLFAPDESGPELVFMLSTGQAGSQLFSTLFDAVEGVRYLHKPPPDILQLAIDYARGKVSFDEATHEIERTRSIIRHVLKAKGPLKLYIESNNQFFSLLRPLRNAFPKAKLVYIFGNEPHSGVPDLGHLQSSNTNPDLRANMFPNAPNSERWDTMDRFEQLAWDKQKKNELILRDFSEMDNTLKVHSENIFKAPDRSGLWEIIDFIGLNRIDLEPIIKDTAKSHVYAHLNHHSAEVSG